VLNHLRAKKKMAFKINAAKSNTQGNLLFALVWVLTAVAAVERSFNARAARKQTIHE
jgi:hypothetical protein